MNLKIGSFEPTISPSEDWIIFVNEMWEHLAPFGFQGISPVQYEITLESHFTGK